MSFLRLQKYVFPPGYQIKLVTYGAYVWLSSPNNEIVRNLDSPKYICYFLIGKVLDFIKLELVPGLQVSGNLNALTEDCEDDFQLKEEMETKCRVFKDALDAIHDF
ncbi:hypothetical protein JTE90_018334 [Oedothorax gibbosus]|uniref:Dynamin GTPase effector domain-containing protein n=1 Tax=Oedothorax gibbosus TaxID=931172 RepID=A0AAV6TZN4_9ARAC|nr:hypothetical protein JTE90_018334 [Oedothorax gibbosus]